MGKPKSKSDSMSKADRKFEKKLDFYTKVRDTVAALSAKKDINKVKTVSSFHRDSQSSVLDGKTSYLTGKKRLRSRQKKLKAYDLASLSEFLPEIKASEQPPTATDAKLNPKSMQKLIMKERTQLNTVLSHPAFHSDPLGSIHQHLVSTQPPVEEKPKKKTRKNGSKKAKRKKSEDSSGPQSMEN